MVLHTLFSCLDKVVHHLRIMKVRKCTLEQPSRISTAKRGVSTATRAAKSCDESGCDKA